ncbi:MAG: hypothetical protein A2104_04575 [Candidatus Melainabacteria bacterium GWF2_32_7]|nr:MAG: hypothetical protein A2104_04575 [Candidatus Melainabacteria bacterium GWF2_32_7]
MKKLEGLIFDLDGTLADTLPHCLKSFQLTFEQVTGREFSDNEITKYFGLSEEGIIKKVLPDKYDECLNTFLEIYENNHHPYSKLFDGIIEILEYAKNKGIKLAMVTGKGRGSADITLKYLNIGHYFEFVEIGSSEGLIKSEGIKRILSNWQIKKENVAYVGDAITDITESRDAGISPIAVSWASTTDHSSLITHNPHLIFSKTEDFMYWLNSIN